LGRSHARPPVKLWEPTISTTCRTPEIGYPPALAAAPCDAGKPNKTEQVQDRFDDRIAQAAAARDQLELLQQLERDFIDEVAVYLYGPDALDHHSPVERQIVPQISISHQHRECDDNPPPF